MKKHNIGILLVFFTTFAVIAVYRHPRRDQAHSFTPVHADSESKKPAQIPESGLTSLTSQQASSAASLQEEEPTKFGYLLARSYLGQQSTGIRSLVSQQCIVGSLNLPMYVVEPFIPESRFEGFRRPVQDYMTNHVPAMKDYFDIDQYNAASEDKGWAKLAPWEDFVKNIPQKVIFVWLNITAECVCMARDEPKLSSPIKVTWSASATEPCSNTSLKPIENLPNRENLCIVRVINANASPDIDLSAGELEVLFGQWKPHEVTLVFHRWCPSIYVKKSAMTSACKGSCEKELDNLLYPSPKLLKHVKRYEMKFLRERSNFKVAVMMRSEIMSPKTCIKEVIRFVRQNFTTDAMFVTADVGRYGSSTWLKKNKIAWAQFVKAAVVTILNNTLTFEEWEDSFTDITEGMTSGGYIAALQRAIASRADCLVLAGGGNFLKVALYEYLDNHPKRADQCVHLLCAPKGFEGQYYSILRAGDK